MNHERQEPSDWLEPLSQREREILSLIKEGLSNREVANVLHLSLETVKWYNKQVFSKLGVNNRTKAVVKARQLGLLAHREEITEQAVSPPPNNLPHQLTPLVGRDTELAELTTLLADPTVRLVTIIGPGGIGKTRLALAVAERFLQQSSSPTPPVGFPLSNGLFVITLTGIQKPELVFPDLANILNYQFEKGNKPLRSPKQQLLDYLKHKQMLLVMDNFEHLVQGAGLVTDILLSAPEIKIVATSRERLNLIEEHLYRIEGLTYPETIKFPDHLISEGEEITNYPAIKLFLQSARRLQPGFTLTNADKEPMIQICQKVEGMPLALELAASWVNALSISEIASEIERSYTFMQTGVRNIQERHRSMRAVFDSTWQRLTLEEQSVFAQLALFQGSFTREEAQRITLPPATPGLLASLTNKSLLVFDRKNTRFHIHELLRQYGADQIALRPDQFAAFQERFGDTFTSIAKELGDALKGASQIRAMAEIEAEIQNIRLAWEWGVSQRQSDLLCRAMQALGLFYQRKGRYEEGEALFGAAAAQLSGDAPVVSFSGVDEGKRTNALVLAETLAWQSNFHFLLGYHASSGQLLDKSLNLLGQLASAGVDVQEQKAFTLYLQAVSATMNGEREHARQLCMQSLENYRACEDKWGSAMVLEQLCRIGWYLGDQISTRNWGEESLHIRQKLGDQRGIADTLIELSLVLADELLLDEALSYAEQAVQIYEELDDREKIVNGIFNLGTKRMRKGDYSVGYSLQVKSYQMARELNLRQIIPYITCQLAYITNHLGKYEETRKWTNLCIPLSREMADKRSIAVSLYSLGLSSLSRGQDFEAYPLLSESAAMVRAMKDRRLLAMVLAALGRAAFVTSIEAEAKSNLFQALVYSIEVHGSQAPLETLLQIAFLLSQSTETWAKERAIELHSLATRYPYITNSRWIMDTAGRNIERLFREWPVDFVQACQTRGRVLEIWSTTAALKEELSARHWIDSF